MRESLTCGYLSRAVEERDRREEAAFPERFFRKFIGRHGRYHIGDVYPEWRKRKRLEAALFREVEAEAIMKKINGSRSRRGKNKSIEAEAEAVKA